MLRRCALGGTGGGSLPLPVVMRRSVGWQRLSCSTTPKGSVEPPTGSAAAATSATGGSGSSNGSLKKKSLKALIKEYGLPLVAYYLVLNESLVVLITCALQYNWLGEGDIVSALNYLGASKYIDLESTMKQAITVGPLTVSAKLVTNFGIATAFMSLWTPLQWPFCIATLPYVRRMFRSKRTV